MQNAFDVRNEMVGVAIEQLKETRQTLSRIEIQISKIAQNTRDSVEDGRRQELLSRLRAGGRLIDESNPLGKLTDESRAKLTQSLTFIEQARATLSVDELGWGAEAVPTIPLACAYETFARYCLYPSSSLVVAALRSYDEWLGHVLGSEAGSLAWQVEKYRTEHDKLIAQSKPELCDLPVSAWLLNGTQSAQAYDSCMIFINMSPPFRRSPNKVTAANLQHGTINGGYSYAQQLRLFVNEDPSTQAFLPAFEEKAPELAIVMRNSATTFSNGKLIFPYKGTLPPDGCSYYSGADERTSEGEILEFVPRVVEYMDVVKRRASLATLMAELTILRVKLANCVRASIVAQNARQRIRSRLIAIGG